MSYQEIENIVNELNQPKFRAKQIFDFAFKGYNFDEMSNIPITLRKQLSVKYCVNPVEIIQKIVSKDGTIKYLYKLIDGNIIEGVLMHYKYGYTICVSSQVGCRMGCKFCASGLNGLVRNLSCGEIMGQVLCVNRDIKSEINKRKINNIVLMGSGEPLDNYDEVTKFIRLINQEYSLNISQRNISISTCGLPDKIKKLADDEFTVTLTISLHAPNDEIRNKIMPINTKFGVNEILDSAKYYFNKTGRRIVFEYSLIKNLNDTDFCAKKLSQILKGFPVHVNLINLNSVKERGMIGTEKSKVYAFKEKLAHMGISATVRRTMGNDIEGACGQLRNKFLSENIG